MSRRSPDLTDEQKQFIYDLYNDDIRPAAIRREFEKAFEFKPALSTITKYSKVDNVPGRERKPREPETPHEPTEVEEVSLEEVNATDFRKQEKPEGKGPYIEIKEEISDEDIDKMIQAHGGEINDQNRALAWEMLSKAYQAGYTRYYTKEKEFA